MFCTADKHEVIINVITNSYLPETYDVLYRQRTRLYTSNFIDVTSRCLMNRITTYKWLEFSHFRGRRRANFYMRNAIDVRESADF